MEPIKLGVNIDHAATLRQARGVDYPDLAAIAALAEKAGAHGITIHLREDRRHIQDADVYRLRKTLTTRMNLEMANNPDVVRVALDVVPDEVCLVPERRQELTTEGGLDAAGQLEALRPTVAALAAQGTQVSLFIAPDRRQLDAAAALGAPYVELHTGAYANAAGDALKRELDALHEAAAYGATLGLKVNAGHGLTMDNVKPLLDIPNLDTLNIGHSIVAHALFVGMEQSVRDMLTAIRR
ncbi:MAG TPA: pyridoxine 5'-phosphate synthase [Candidatus Spyradenecus faecavium]|uniref:Pyridoxine 5'-phosphate synthase n=1 Tax=Candidatus Spyradenecus faecavium TaxID=2840947 RepID=A0A9D1NN34_9BACT|nr:pyridoxine 5'-phosphate synthase [Candidatus Spyradenecus faecavium]